MQESRCVVFTVPLTVSEKHLLELQSSQAGLSSSEFIRRLLLKEHFDNLRQFLREWRILPEAEEVGFFSFGAEYVLLDYVGDNPFFYISTTYEKDELTDLRSLSASAREERRQLKPVGLKEAALFLADAFTSKALDAGEVTTRGAELFLRGVGLRVPRSSLEAVIRRAKNRYCSSYLEVLRKAGESSKGAPT